MNLRRVIAAPHLSAASMLIAFSVTFFSPVIFGGKIFLSDGQYSSFTAPFTTWNLMWQAGFPQLADTPSMTMYPIRILLKGLELPLGFNIFVVSAYMLAGIFTFGYVEKAIGNRFAALIAGISFAFGGFMIGHLGHTSMIHAAAWVPLLLWSLEELRQRYSVYWVAISMSAVVMCVLAGHLQIFAYSMMLAAAYVAFFATTAAIGWKRYLLVSALIFASGIGIACVQLFPTLELAPLTPRGEMTFERFNSLALPLYQIPHIIFPYLFGSESPSQIFVTGYFGEANTAEVAGYVGMTGLVFAIIGFLAYRQHAIARFWALVAVLSFLFALGDATPFAWVLYQIPVLNKFRVPARHLLEMTLAFTVLVALGTTALMNNMVSMMVLRRTLCATAVFFITTVIAVFLFYEKLEKLASQKDVVIPGFFLNPAIWVPSGIFIVTLLTLLLWRKDLPSCIKQGMILTAITIGLLNFAWFAYWRTNVGVADSLAKTPYIDKYHHLVTKTDHRIFPIEGHVTKGFGPEISRIHQIPSLSWYGPLLLTDFSALSSINGAGVANPIIASTENSAPDILGAKYLFANGPRSYQKNSLVISREDLPITLGKACDKRTPEEISLRLFQSLRATKITVVSYLACSTETLNNQEVVRLTAHHSNNKTSERSLLAGRDTSEWAIECKDVKQQIKHSKAAVFDKQKSRRLEDPECQIHTFVSSVTLPGELLTGLTLKWAGAPATTQIMKLSIQDERTGEIYLVSRNDLYFLDHKKWKPLEALQEVLVFENTEVLPRAWLVPEVVSMSKADVLRTIHTSQMPGGTKFDPRKTALTEEPYAFLSPANDHNATVRIVQLDDTAVGIQTSSKAPAFLVLSDMYYPGWRATIDDIEIPIIKTNYALRGIPVPAGEHLIRFSYRPTTLYLGAAISAITVLMLIGLLVMKQLRTSCSIWTRCLR